jgi:hypothetical protein
MLDLRNDTFVRDLSIITVIHWHVDLLGVLSLLHVKRRVITA